jgi:hypothetical protein
MSRREYTGDMVKTACQTESDTLRNDALSRRIVHFRKAFARGLGHRPSALQSAAILRAATLQAQAELVLADPAVSINDKVRIDGAARRALIDMRATLQAKRKPDKLSNLDAYLAHKGAA